MKLAQVRIEQRVIMRVPMPPPPGPPPSDRLPPDMEWEEKGKGPKCIPIRALRSARVSSHRTVDLVLRDRTRLRAKLGRGCRSDDLYSGFYIQPNPDGSLCADRDELLARSGMSCEINSFRWLAPRRP